MENLATLAIGQECSIVAAPSSKIMHPLGLRNGKTVKVHGRSPFGGPLLLEVDGRILAVDARAASSIQVVGRCTGEIPQNVAIDGSA